MAVEVWGELGGMAPAFNAFFDSSLRFEGSKSLLQAAQ